MRWSISELDVRDITQCYVSPIYIGSLTHIQKNYVITATMESVHNLYMKNYEKKEKYEKKRLKKNYIGIISSFK